MLFLYPNVVRLIPCNNNGLFRIGNQFSPKLPCTVLSKWISLTGRCLADMTLHIKF